MSFLQHSSGGRLWATCATASVFLVTSAGAANKPHDPGELEVAPGTRVAGMEAKAATSLAPPAKTEPNYENRYVGVVLTSLSYTGMGGGVRVGLESVGLLATATAQSLFFWAVSDAGLDRGDYSGEFKFLTNGQINLDAYATFGRKNARFRIGGSAGFRHNTLLENGLAAGAYGVFNLRPDVAVQLQIGLAYYPGGNAAATSFINRCDDAATDPEAPCGLVPLYDAGFQPGISIGLLLFP